jgi:hypothetical protein
MLGETAFALRPGARGAPLVEGVYRAPRTATIAMDVQVILTPPCYYFIRDSQYKIHTRVA